MTAIDHIRARFPGVRSMFAHLGITVPERDGAKFRHPFRPDNKPSCTIKGDRLYDWSQGDRRGLDAIGVFAAAKSLSNTEAIKVLAAEFVPAEAPRKTAPVGKAPKKLKQLEVTRPAKPPFRKLETATADDLAALGKLRVIFDSALKAAVEAGHLFFAETKEGRAWVVTDTSRRVCQSRRLDGEPWQFLASKAWTSVKEHGCAGWPLGAAEIGSRERVILCEGGPDWLVAHEAEPEIAVCTMLGAGQAIHAEALPLFAGKTVRILAHGDAAGTEACQRWAEQLTKAGAIVTAMKIHSGEARDLNDCTRLTFAEWEHYGVAKYLE